MAGSTPEEIPAESLCGASQLLIIQLSEERDRLALTQTGKLTSAHMQEEERKL